jgi:hypothetical protein
VTGDAAGIVRDFMAESSDRDHKAAGELNDGVAVVSGGSDADFDNGVGCVRAEERWC